MKYRKKILTVGVTGALLLNISGAVSPLNNTLADAQGTTTANTDQELQRVKDEAIKKLEEYPEAFDKSLNGLADAFKEQYKKNIREAKSQDEIKEILKTVENAHNLNKAKKEGKAFLDKLTHVGTSQLNETRNKIGSAKKSEEIINQLKDCLKKELDGYPYAFNKALYGDLSEGIKNSYKKKIHDEADTQEKLNNILDELKKS